ncbi:serine hydrolase domain-containing protein [uncultured Aquimarina sp.]|uniref:serine hydrolase domain-containing protein n=1 Tax=uncultured Aquimarina sp. TaxID=575652 RepID=UPI002618B9AC|nr:serine hydrolase domain-containing protein [uncultured Aquimarina sp.]
MRTVIKALIFFVGYSVISQTNIQKLEHKLDSIYKNSSISGFGVSVITPDEILFEKGFGYADKAVEKGYTVNTIQNIGSVSKTFIGIALMKAIEQGKLSEDTPINDILPFKVEHPKFPETPILVKHLATHTSSILDTEAYEKSYVLEPDSTLDLESYTKEEQKEYKAMSANKKYSLKDFLYNHLNPEGLWYSKKNYKKQKPGERYEYSNVGSALLAFVIELATETPFEEYTKKFIFDKLNMNNTGWSYASIDASKHSKTYTETGNEIPKYSLITYPDGGIRSSVKDLTLYLQELMKGHYGSGKILEKESFTEMMSPKISKAQFNTKKEIKDNYGFFWEVSPKGKMGHNGSDPGILTLMYFNKNEKVGAIFFMNTSVEGDKELIKSVQNIWRSIKKYKKDYINTI